VRVRASVVIAVIGFASAIVSSEEAQARRRHHHHARHSPIHYSESAGHSQHASRIRPRMRRHGIRHRAHRWPGFAASSRPAAWCGWWLGQYLGMSDRRLWLSRNWASVGHNVGGPDVGVVVVWRHHVGIITGRSGNEWIVKSGNDAGQVRERARSVRAAIAFRRV
jgi:hypothetical protein